MLFEDEEVVAVGRVRLSGLRESDVEAMQGWIEAALAPDWQIEALMEAVVEGRGALVSDAEGVAIGVAAVEPGPVAGSWGLPFLTIDPSRRFRGLGGEAGLAM